MKGMFSGRWGRRLAGGIVGWLGGLAQVLACAICAPSDQQATVAFQLRAADTLVLASAAPAGGWRVQALARGVLPPEPIVLPPADGAAAGATRLLAYNAAGRSWKQLGALSLQRLPWLQRVQALAPVGTIAVSEWPARLAGLVGDLEDAEPLVAQLAYEEIAAAPYGAMRSLRPRLDAARVLRWLDDPALLPRWPLYALLAGIGGAPADAAALRERLARLPPQAGTAAAAGLLAAVLELQGEAALAWVEDSFLSNPAAAEERIRAAAQALGVHGSDGQRIGRARVIAAFTRMAARHPALAGWAASDLATWGHWELGPRYAEILGSGMPMPFASRYAMVFYLLRSPQPEARAALERLRAQGAL